jgi:hypothetical protein
MQLILLVSERKITVFGPAIMSKVRGYDLLISGSGEFSPGLLIGPRYA